MNHLKNLQHTSEHPILPRFPKLERAIGKTLSILALFAAIANPAERRGEIPTSCSIGHAANKITLICNGNESLIDDSTIKRTPQHEILLSTLKQQEQSAATLATYLQTIEDSHLAVIGPPDRFNPNQNCYGYSLRIAIPSLQLPDDVWLESTGAQKILNAVRAEYIVSPDQLYTYAFKENDIVIITKHDKDTGEHFFIHATYIIKSENGQLLLEGKDAERYILRGTLKDTLTYFLTDIPLDLQTELFVYR